MRWYDHIYIGTYAAERLDEIREDIEQEEFLFPQLYLITLASNGVDQLDLFPAGRLAFHKSMVRYTGMLVGAAIGREEAMEVLRRIASDTVLATGGCDMRSYLMKRYRTDLILQMTEGEGM
ncbi:MAG: hypothetical protein IJ121_12500 [Eubacterium sp.]|nr:hypothetical protein [Eubacterium sp.]